MSRIQTTFEHLKQNNQKALVAYLTAGDPNIETCIQAAHVAIQNGANILEIGIPFSDPVADGPVIQRAMLRALAKGSNSLEHALKVVQGIRAQHSTVPIVLFGYANPMFFHGIQESCLTMKQAGVDGVLVVDIPGEEAGPYRAACIEQGLDFIALVAPTTGIERTRMIAQQATGFIYMISMTGVTGGALTSTQRIQPLIQAVRDVSATPICVGFGIHDHTTAAAVAPLAEGAVVGSAIVSALERGIQSGEGVGLVAKLIQELRAGLDSVS